MSLIEYRTKDNIATITINRADRMNALNEDVIQGLKSAWLELEASDDRVAILHAAGTVVFIPAFVVSNLGFVITYRNFIG